MANQEEELKLVVTLLETLRRSRFPDSLRDAEESEGIRGIRHGYYY
jgi:hypothetical protein